MRHIGRAVVEKIESLYRVGRYREAIETWTRINPRLDPDLQARARLVLGRCSFALLQFAEWLHDRHRYGEAIEMIEPIVRLDKGLATQAKFLLERCLRAHRPER
jgi:tetratricopeptide (TPR) repeat protein